MTISKERFEAICFEAADEINENGGGYIFKQDDEAFGLALIKRVEAERKTNYGGFPMLPLVSEE